MDAKASWRRWKLSPSEKLLLAEIVDAAGEPPLWVPAAHPERALRRPEERPEMLLNRRSAALAHDVTKIDQHLERALGDFMAGELWSLLHTIWLAEQGPTRGRRTALHDAVREHLRLADEAVAAWRDLRRASERATAVVEHRLRGWDDPAWPRFRNSAPLEAEYRIGLDNAEQSLRQYAAHQVLLWQRWCQRTQRMDRIPQRVAMRREAVGLMKAGGLGYQRIAALATSPHWRRPPCPGMTHARVSTLVKQDLTPKRRRPATWSAPIEV